MYLYATVQFGIVVLSVYVFFSLVSLPARLPCTMSPHPLRRCALASPPSPLPRPPPPFPPRGAGGRGAVGVQFRMQVVASIFLATSAGFGLAMCGRTVALRLLRWWRQRRRRPAEGPPSP